MDALTSLAAQVLTEKVMKNVLIAEEYIATTLGVQEEVSLNTIVHIVML